MSEINSDGPAYPFCYEDRSTRGIINTVVHEGMTLRMRMAMAAMQGMLASPSLILGVFNTPEINVTRQAVAYADTLIAELNKPKA